MIALKKEQIIQLHHHLIEATGGSHGMRDEGLLDSALAAPYATFGGEEFFSSIEEKAARLAIGLVTNHPIFVGNKRTTAHSMLALLRLNGIKQRIEQKEM